MAKVLIKKGKKEFIKELNREVLVVKPATYYVKDPDKDYHTTDGVISKKDLSKKDGSVVKTNNEKEFTIFTSSFPDDFRKIGRSAQIIPLKDIGLIIAETGINKNSIVVDAGAGSGALACFLAHICKEVTTYEIRDDFCKIVNENKKFLNLKNLKVKKEDIYLGIEEKDVDLVTLDVPEPWKALETAKKALKVGGFLVSYSPSIPQTMDFVNAIKQDKDLTHIKTIEVIQREWEIDERKVRPITTQTVHTGFLSFARRLS